MKNPTILNHPFLSAFDVSFLTIFAFSDMFALFQTINFIEKKFVGKHSESVRALAGHTNDLHNLISHNKDPSLAIYLFDEHLQKVLA